MRQKEASTAKHCARGKWSQKDRAITHLLNGETLKVHTFRADSGHTAIMEKLPGRHNPYICTVSDPQRKPASRTSEQGQRITRMEMHLNLRCAKLTVQEAVHEIQEQEKNRREEERNA